MPNVNDLIDDDDDDESQLSDSDLVKKLRKELKAKTKDGEAMATLRRENAMLKAGVDTSTKLGALFARSFEGDLSDIEAIKAEAAELGISAPVANANAQEGEGQGQEGEGANAGDQGGQGSAAERSNLATGAMPDDGQGVDPRQAAIDGARDRMNKGQTFEKAAGGFISDLAQAAAAGDARVIVPKGNAF